MAILKPWTVAALLLASIAGGAAAQQAPTVDAVLSSVIGLSAVVPPDARTAGSLGTEREGHGVVIDSDGLVLTIGYLILEAESVTLTTNSGRTVPARIVAYDHASGFGLVRALQDLELRPLPLADSAEPEIGQRMMVAGSGGERFAIVAQISSRRTFAGYWEYLLEDAIFTEPPHPLFGGAALIDPAGHLVGIGSLFVNDAPGPEQFGPGNMFVPVNALKPILAELIENGRSSAPRRPWLGLYPAETGQGLLVSRVAPDGPAAIAGMLPGSLILGVNGAPAKGLEDFYRRVWAVGGPGDVLRLTLIDPAGEPGEVAITAGDRYDWLRLKPSH